jgi:predicted nucleic acid-binding Zn ribbon protein
MPAVRRSRQPLPGIKVTPGRRGAATTGGRRMRRLAPRALSTALEGVVRDVAPATLLARVQAVWTEVAGERLAGAAAPVSERDGVVTVACQSGVWAHELDLLAPDLLRRLEGALGGPLVTKLRFVVGSAPNSV